MDNFAEANKALEGAKRLLQAVVNRHPDAAASIAEVTSLLSNAEEVIARQGRPILRRTGKGARYVIENVNNRPMLAECRGKGRPLRVDEQLFAGVVGVLAQTTKPLAFDEIVEGVGQPPNRLLVEWQIRVVLRFLLRADPPILQRVRSRYFPEAATGFEAAASRWWATAAQQALHFADSAL